MAPIVFEHLINLIKKISVIGQRRVRLGAESLYKIPSNIGQKICEEELAVISSERKLKNQVYGVNY